MHLDPGTGDDCPFCSQTDTIYHLCIQCSRLARLFRQFKSWFQGLGELFPFVFLSMVHTTRQRKECTHSYKFHVRSGQISYLENKEKSCEGCRVRGRGSDADRAAGSSAQGGV